MRQKLVIGTSLLISLLFSLSIVGSAGASSFDAGRVIDDAIFDNTNTMNTSQINTWLNTTYGSASCISTDHGFTAPDPIGYNPTQGFLYGSSVSAGQVINDSAQAYGLNPQVLLTTLEKEQSLVSGGAGCSTLRYVGATGYGCPDGGTTYNYSGVDLYSINGQEVTSVNGTCVSSSLDVGFSQQVIHATWLLKFGEQRSQGNVGWAVIKGGWDNSDDPQSCYSGPMIQGTWARCPGGGSVYYDGYTTIDGTSTQIVDGATAALYWYTPHFAGNENFSTIFNEWFGPPTNNADAWELVQDSSTGKVYLVSGRTAYWVPGPIYMTAWGLNNYTATQVDDTFLANLTIGPNLTYVGLDINGTRYLMSDGEKYELTSDNDVLDWDVAGIDHISAPGYVAQIPSGGNAGNFATDASTGITYLLDGTQKLPGLTTQSLGYWGQDSADTTTVTSDILARLTTGPAVDRYVSVGGSDMVVDQGTAFTFKNAAMESAWGQNTYVDIGAYATNMIAQMPATNFILDTTTGRWYYLEGGNKHYITNTSLAQMWGWGTSDPLIGVSDALASQFTTGANLSYLAATSSGSVYLADGTKHLIAASYVPSWDGPQTPQVFSNDAFSLLGSGANIQTATVGFAGSPRIYAMDDGQLRYISTPTVLDALGGYRNNPIITLSQSVFSFIPQGTTITTPFVQTAPGTTYYLDDGYEYTINPNSINTWGATSPATVSVSYLANAITSTGETLGNALSVGSTKYLVNSQTLLNVSDDFGNYGLTAADFTPIADLPFPVRQSSSFLVGTPASGKIWLLSMGELYYIPTPALLYDLGYGSHFGIVSLNSDIFATLPQQSTVATQLLKAPGTGVIFASIGDGYGFRDSGTLSDYSAGQVFTIPATYFNRFPFVGWASQLIAGTDGKVYAVADGQKHWVTSPALLNKYYGGQSILWISQNTIDAMPTGSAITS